MWRLPAASFLCAFYLALRYLFDQTFSSMPRLEWLVRDLCGIPMVMDLSKRCHAVASLEPEGYRSHFVCFPAAVPAIYPGLGKNYNMIDLEWDLIFFNEPESFRPRNEIADSLFHQPLSTS